MLRMIAPYLFSFLLSFSIMGPSLLVLVENEVDIEVVQDFEEEEKEEKPELEEHENAFSTCLIFFPTLTAHSTIPSRNYLVKHYGHIRDISSPPPDRL